MKSLDLSRGAVVKSKDLEWRSAGSCRLAVPINTEMGSKNVRCLVVDIPKGAVWKSCSMGRDSENVVVIFSGKGTAKSGEVSSEIERSSSIYVPTGCDYEISSSEEIRAYVWQSSLPAGKSRNLYSKRFNHLYNSEILFTGFGGTGDIKTDSRKASMNFIFWPGSGSPHLCLHCGIQLPGEEFSVHHHDIAEELFIGFEGEGEVHLDGEWHPFSAGDILYSPPNVRHGTRNPQVGPDAKVFVTCGGPTPSDETFYIKAGLSAEVAIFGKEKELVLA